MGRIRVVKTSKKAQESLGKGRGALKVRRNWDSQERVS